MTGLSGIPRAPKPFGYNTNDYLWTPQPSNFLNDAYLSPDYSSADDSFVQGKRNTKRSKRTKKRSRSSKHKKREYRLQGYILQIIGLLCFALAAVKSFEPLTGVGFTLVLLGYNKNTRRKSRIDLSGNEERHRSDWREKRKHKKVVAAMEDDGRGGVA